MRPNNTSPKKPVLASQNIKDLLDSGMTAWKIKKLGVSSKRITKISNGIIPDKRGRKSKFTDAHKDYVIELAKADPRISNKMIRSLFEQNFGFTVSSGKVSEWLHQGMLFSFDEIYNLKLQRKIFKGKIFSSIRIQEYRKTDGKLTRFVLCKAKSAHCKACHLKISLCKARKNHNCSL